MADEKATPDKAKASKIFDVQHPSKTTASPTSRPVIVGHTNTIKRDPMVTPPEPSAAPEQVFDKKELLDKPKSEITLKPVGEQPVEETPEVVESFEITDQTVEDLPAEEEAVTEPLQEEDSQPEFSDENGAAVEAIVAGVNTKKEKQQQLEKEAKQTAEIQGLVNSKKYYVKTHLPPGKRNLRWLVVLLVLVLLGGAGWYFGVGPGKEYWNKEPASQTTAPTSNTQTSQPTTTESSQTKQLKEYKNQDLGVSFSYPLEWKVAVVKDSEFPTRDIITLTSPVETIKTTSGAEAVEAEVYLRTRIIVENTTSASEYASDLIALPSCETEDVIVAATPLKFIFHDTAQKQPSISQVSVGPSDCTPQGTNFKANDQVQLATKKNTYVIYTEYVFSDAYLKKNGTTDEEAIKTAQESGIVVSKESFTAGKNFIAFQSLAKSFKEL